ncbi:MAG: DUF2207 domain-containing protein [Candidatus Woesebacteria bacterium]
MRTLLACLFGFLFFCSASKSQAQVLPATYDPERIGVFESLITVHQDTSITVEEKITYQTFLTKHGIFRTIPYQYNREGFNYTARIKQIIVTDGNGESIPYTQSYEKGNVVLKIGDKNSTFTGTKIYKLSYVVENAIQKSEGDARLYWDITGEGWQIPIDYSTATVRTQVGSIRSAHCYSGIYGGDDRQCVISNTNPTDHNFVYQKRINYGDNFTVDLLLTPQSAFVFPTPQQIVLKQILDNLWMVLLPLPILTLFFIWYRYGRDFMFVRYNVFDQSNREKILRPLFSRFPAPMVYEPLDITPGQAGAMLDEAYDSQDLVADILDLASKKYIKIEQVQEKTLFKNADYSFIKLKEADKDLPEHEKLILAGLFEEKKTVKVSELKGKFYLSIDLIKKSVFTSLFSQTMFTRDPNTFQKKIATVMIGGGVFFYLILRFSEFFLPYLTAFRPEQIIIAVSALLIEGIAGFFLIKNLTQKTAKGFNYMQQARGLKETINRGKWREEIKEKHLFIEEILPFAVALGVVNQLTRDMKQLNIAPPSYFHGTSMNTFATASFLHSFSRDVGTSISYNPSSSSWSSGGGGGFSGGGGGGGGGGSW